jgi:undecaprenyl-diphosphatase
LTVSRPGDTSEIVDFLWITVLGALQGATEFLPVSSSGHLAAGQLMLFGGDPHGGFTDKPLLLEVLLHLATLLAVVAVYRRDVVAVIRGAGRGLAGLFRGRLGQLAAEDDGVNLALAIAAGLVPTAAIGFLLREPAGVVSRSPLGLGFSFLACACLLIASRWWPGGTRRLSWRTGLLIGAVQGVAVLPGISRSGVTIATALALGLDREQAVRFSFLLSVPAILGAAAVELDVEALATGGHGLAFAVSALVAFAVGLGALLLLIRLVRGGRLWMFAPYLAAVAIFSLFFLG